ncbi:hypothetical protein [Wenxinia saemankumensis]|uniref:Uncharacterized protein n=1 Tax=Wenxinia saemankumensis TaxID=1447782 RepID=A0A1M6GM46_9RHOB|nr:hypothetical protein [Wenxinia saemankumensis]SHJ10972.1 hypothetical protein SAMN05444417_2806 [Wenxinia saemankumensis]
MTDHRTDPPPVPPGLADLLDESLALLRSVRKSVRRVLDAVEDETGEFTIRDLVQKAGELEQSLRMALQIEIRFNEWRERHDGTYLAPDEIDFDAVRADLGCRIARLRQCCQDRRGPEGPE